MNGPLFRVLSGTMYFINIGYYPKLVSRDIVYFGYRFKNKRLTDSFRAVALMSAAVTLLITIIMLIISSRYT